MFKGGQHGTWVDNSESQVANNQLIAYPHALNFYEQPPLFDVTLEEFESCALNRLRVLAEIESSLARNRTWEELKEFTKIQCEKYLPLTPSRLGTQEILDQERKQDHLSHYVLRLAFSRSEDLKRRFVKAETCLFKVRYETALNEEREQFLKSKNFDWNLVTLEEQNQLKENLERAFVGSKSEFERAKYHKIKWTRVPDLIEKRRVFLKGGWAYVPTKDQSSIVFHKYETTLEHDMERTNHLLPTLDEDNRLVPILDNLSQGFLAGGSSDWAGASGSENSDEIKAEMIDELARKSFPLCMRMHHENLRRDKHLKHFARLEYGLFLKVLGVSIDEAIVFWRKSFSRIEDDKFNKEYRYNIRHSYGLEGKRANYPAKTCIQLLAPGSSEHGCPYRNYSEDNLPTTLTTHYGSQGLRPADTREVMDIVKGKHYHVACTRVFELTHASCGVEKGDGLGGGESVTHPNQYAARSIELRKPKDDMVVDS